MTEKATRLSKKQKSIAEWDALVQRYPLSAPQALLQPALVTVGSNVLTVQLLVSGRMQPLQLVLLVGLEAFFLSLVGLVQTRSVPESALMEKPAPLGQRLATLSFGLFWLAVVYAAIFYFFLRAGDQLAALRDDPAGTLLAAGLQWPLALTVAGAVVDAVRDHLHFRDLGGYFISTPGLGAAARWLTLFLGGIPFVIPIFAIGVGVTTLVKRLSKGRHEKDVRWAIVLVPLLSFSLFGVMGWLLNHGVTGWAVGYCSAKIASELFLVFLPLIASRAKAEETAALNESGKSRDPKGKPQPPLPPATEATLPRPPYGGGSKRPGKVPRRGASS